jgi:hypothetical protein
MTLIAPGTHGEYEFTMVADDAYRARVTFTEDNPKDIPMTYTISVTEGGKTKDIMTNEDLDSKTYDSDEMSAKQPIKVKIAWAWAHDSDADKNTAIGQAAQVGISDYGLKLSFQDEVYPVSTDDGGTPISNNGDSQVTPSGDSGSRVVNNYYPSTSTTTTRTLPGRVVTTVTRIPAAVADAVSDTAEKVKEVAKDVADAVLPDTAQEKTELPNTETLAKKQPWTWPMVAVLATPILLMFLLFFLLREKLYSPVQGRVIAAETDHDLMFKAVGPNVTAPVSGTIIELMPKARMIAIKTRFGKVIRVMIATPHDLSRQFAKLSVDDKVKAGDILATLDQRDVLQVRLHLDCKPYKLMHKVEEMQDLDNRDAIAHFHLVDRKHSEPTMPKMAASGS